MADYLYWHEREWVIMIEWAKTIPVYQMLGLNDKVRFGFLGLIFLRLEKGLTLKNHDFRRFLTKNC